MCGVFGGSSFYFTSSAMTSTAPTADRLQGVWNKLSVFLLYLRHRPHIVIVCVFVLNALNVLNIAWLSHKYRMDISSVEISLDISSKCVSDKQDHNYASPHKSFANRHGNLKFKCVPSYHKTLMALRQAASKWSDRFLRAKSSFAQTIDPS